MPRRSEAALFAVRIVVDDVDARDVSLLVDGDVVVRDTTPILGREEAAIASSAGSLPHLFHDRAGILQGIVLMIELRPLATHHVEQDGIVVGRMRLARSRSCGHGGGGIGGGPVLGTERPGVSIHLIAPLGNAPVFRIETNEVHCDTGRVMLLQQACQFQHHSHTRSTVVGSHHRFAPVGRVRVVVSPGTTVPVGTDEDA